MSARLIPSSLFASRCARCGKRIEQGQPAMYDRVLPRGRRAWHPECDAIPAPAAAPKPVPAAAAARAESNGAELSARFPEYAQVHVFDDVEALLQAAAAPRNPGSAWNDWANSNRHDGEWYGLHEELPAVANLAQVSKLVREGWTRGARMIEETLGGFTVDAKPRSIRRTRTRRDFGAEVDVTEYWRGRADIAWSDCVRAMRPARVHYTIVNDALASGALDAESLFWRGAAVVALADKLTAAGYGVRVVSAWHAPDHGGLVCYTVCKPFDAPIDLPTLAASCANPGFFRCIGHTWGNGTESEQAHHGHGYSVRPWPEHDSEILASNRGTWNADAAKAWIAEQIARIQGEQERRAA